MPATKSKVDLSKSLKKHAKDETDYGVDLSRLPAGITNGIAELVEAKLSVYAKGPNIGQKFLYLAGTVIEPISVVEQVKSWDASLAGGKGGVRIAPPVEKRVRGLRTSVMIPLCDTKNAAGEVTDYDEHVKRALNELRKLGGEECTADVETEEDLIALLATLKEAAPRFKFGTSTSGDPTAQYPTQRVWENWYGTKDVEQGGEPEAEAVQDDTGPLAEATEEEPQDAVESPGDDPTALAEAADGGDADAGTRLNDLALEAGISQKKIDGAKDWGTVAGWLSAETSESEEDEWEPAVKEVYGYKPKGSNGKPGKESDHEVLSVNTEAKTVTLKHFDSGKVVLGANKKPLAVSWDDLIGKE